MNRWLVYYGRRKLTEVYYTKSCDAEYVRVSLINHDGLPNGIRVYLA